MNLLHGAWFYNITRWSSRKRWSNDLPNIDTFLYTITLVITANLIRKASARNCQAHVGRYVLQNLSFCLKTWFSPLAVKTVSSFLCSDMFQVPHVSLASVRYIKLESFLKKMKRLLNIKTQYWFLSFITSNSFLR